MFGLLVDKILFTLSGRLRQAVAGSVMVSLGFGTEEMRNENENAETHSSYYRGG